ncbi:hypothetical protein J5N97_018891 [Dioscorea zingiberensis]|uniref:Uncharacterized protein n=1 Tax=Dioscorea zingiberensis TaxID=325984 RepID=A0A9D5CDZ8_9LILI|nr:hypothetical protein J5N97_018891 [Dioscorea zingiberensis]
MRLSTVYLVDFLANAESEKVLVQIGPPESLSAPPHKLLHGLDNFKISDSESNLEALNGEIELEGVDPDHYTEAQPENFCCCCVGDTSVVIERIAEKDLDSWGSIIAALALTEQLEAWNLFKQMLDIGDHRPTEFHFGSIVNDRVTIPKLDLAWGHYHSVPALRMYKLLFLASRPTGPLLFTQDGIM